jgi:predicted nucleic acid-binding protein
MTTFVDTNVFIELLREDSDFHAWAKDTIAERRGEGPLVICDVVFSELSVGLETLEKTNLAIEQFAVERLNFSDEVLVRAGAAFKRYRDINKGPKINVLPDFFIGAQAAVEDAPLITINDADFRSYFPSLKLIKPPNKTRAGAV